LRTKRKKNGRLNHALFILLLPILAFSNCANVGVQRRIEISYGNTVDEKIKYAREFVTRSRYESLITQIQLLFPKVSDSSLEQGLNINWVESELRSIEQESHVIVCIVITCKRSATYDASKIADAASVILEKELRDMNLP